MCLSTFCFVLCSLPLWCCSYSYDLASRGFEFETPAFVASTVTARDLIDGYMWKLYHALPLSSLSFSPKKERWMFTRTEHLPSPQVTTTVKK